MRRLKRVAAILGLAVSLAGCASLVTGGPLVRPGEPTGALEIVNGSSRTFTAILISRCSAASYGLNRLPGGVTVPPGRSYRFTVSAGCWDVDAGLAYNEARFRTQVPAGRLVRHTVVDPR